MCEEKGQYWGRAEIKEKTGIYLHVTLRDVQRRKTSVGETARKSAAEHALGIIARIVGDRPKIPEKIGRAHV